MSEPMASFALTLWAGIGRPREASQVLSDLLARLSRNVVRWGGGGRLSVRPPWIQGIMTNEVHRSLLSAGTRGFRSRLLWGQRCCFQLWSAAMLDHLYKGQALLRNSFQMCSDFDMPSEEGVEDAVVTWFCNFQRTTPSSASNDTHE